MSETPLCQFCGVRTDHGHDPNKCSAIGKPVEPAALNEQEERAAAESALKSLGGGGSGIFSVGYISGWLARAQQGKR